MRKCGCTARCSRPSIGIQAGREVRPLGDHADHLGTVTCCRRADAARIALPLLVGVVVVVGRADLRAENLGVLRGLSLSEADLDKTGVHPEFGTVTLRQLLATWTTHDLGHLVQVARTMARQYRDEAGPWRAYLSVIRD